MHFININYRLTYYSGLIFSFCEEVRVSSEKIALFKGLKVVIHKGLDIGDNAEYTNTLIGSSPDKKYPDKGGSWLKTFFSSEEVSEDPKKKQREDILKNLEIVISTCLFCISDNKLSVEISKQGLAGFSSVDNVKLSHPSLEILDPIMNKYPNEFLRSVIEIWKTSLNTNEEDSKKLLKLLLSMDFNGKTFLQALSTYVDTLKINKKKDNESINIEVLSICHLICAVFSCITEESITKLSDDRRSF